MTRLAVMAHFDVSGEVRPHVRRQVEHLRRAFDELVVVSTAKLTDASRAWLTARSTLLERDNEGYDFGSYKAGLDAARQDLSTYDDVVVCNDSFVGPLVDWAQILSTMAARGCDFWGLTESRQHVRHVQSYCLGFRSTALASPAFRRFWDDFEPTSDREQVIQRYELGLSRRLRKAGLKQAAYFTETDGDRRTARRRMAWWALQREPAPRTRAQWAAWRERTRRPWNPTVVLADRALDGARLPLVKVETIRHDLHRLGSGRLLAACEAAYPDDFAGVRDFLEDTAAAYAMRPGDVLHLPPVPLRWAGRLVRYRTRARARAARR
ncbi:rhamnan synthesis F family protein [Nocardioides sp. CER19]|uniref:rhamnan synthesis F family protein n=1 Tax=Nocardioides sp. CER19 TaxID=3038538 RepID=UPI00244BDD52|nr:rhamnan synthesis F family protein [Nocardioides sp. CER19]MDH2416912.1 rhamnan synthesis F family protein [Nocardioides sp. CER19]